MSNRNIIWIEIARTFCIALVVLAHSTDIFLLSEGKPWADWAVIYMSFIRFAVPFFFIISGFLLRLSLDKKTELPGYNSFIKSKFLSLGIPFLVWNALYLVVAHFVMHWNLISLNSLFNLLTGFIHLFFIFVLFQFFIIYYPLHKYIQGKFLNFGLLFSAICSTGFFIFSEYSLWVGKRAAPSFEWTYGKLFFGWALFFFLGIWIGSQPKRIEKIAKQMWLWAMAATGFLVLYAFETKLQIRTFGQVGRFYFLGSGLFYQTASSLFFLGLIFKIGSTIKEGKFTNYMIDTGKDTFAIYIAHYMFVMLLVVAWGNLQFPGAYWIKIPVVFILSWSGTHGFVILLNQPIFSFPKKFLFGFRK